MEFTSSFSTFFPSNCWNFRRQPYGNQFLTQVSLILSSTWWDCLDCRRGMENYSALRTVYDLKHFVMPTKYWTSIIIPKTRLGADITHHKYHIYIKIFFKLIRKRPGQISKKGKSPKAYVRHVSAIGACWTLNVNTTANINFLLLCVLKLEQFWPGAWVPWKYLRRVQEESSAAIFVHIPNRNNFRQTET